MTVLDNFVNSLRDFSYSYLYRGTYRIACTIIVAFEVLNTSLLYLYVTGMLSKSLRLERPWYVPHN
jgi:hypothetical protein